MLLPVRISGLLVRANARLRRGLVIALSLAALLAGGATDAHALRQEARGEPGVVEGQRIDTTFRVERGALVDLQLNAGTIVVTAATGSDIRVRASSENGRVRLRASPTLATLRAISGRGRGGDVEYEIAVPAGVRVLASVGRGDITVRGVRGDVEARTTVGDIELADIQGMVTIETVAGDVEAVRLRGGVRITTMNGDVDLTGVEGDIVIESTSGDMTLSDIRSKVVRAEGVSGDIDFQGALQSDGRYEFTSHSGSVTMMLPPPTGALLTLATYNGSIESQFPITREPTQANLAEKRMQFRLGNGSARITVETFSGDITITRGTRRDRQE